MPDVAAIYKETSVSYIDHILVDDAYSKYIYIYDQRCL
jgi:hypothetical protein